MKDPVQTVKIGGDEVELTKRELLTIDFIARQLEVRHVAPSQKEVMAHLNTHGYELVSYQQTWRIANSLREKKILEVPQYVTPDGDKRNGATHRNMILTKLGFAIANRNRSPGQ